jgi:hypothetical protein
LALEISLGLNLHELAGANLCDLVGAFILVIIGGLKYREVFASMRLEKVLRNILLSGCYRLRQWN